MLSANARVFQTLVFAEEFLKKTLSLLLDFNIFKCYALKYIKIVNK